MTKPIGKRIILALGAVQRLQPCTAQQARDLMGSVKLSNVDKYCSRAVGHGLMTVDTSQSPKRYRVVPDWQERLVAQRNGRLPRPRTIPAADPVLLATAMARRTPLELAWQSLR